MKKFLSIDEKPVTIYVNCYNHVKQREARATGTTLEHMIFMVQKAMTTKYKPFSEIGTNEKFVLTFSSGIELAIQKRHEEGGDYYQIMTIFKRKIVEKKIMVLKKFDNQRVIEINLLDMSYNVTRFRRKKKKDD